MDSPTTLVAQGDADLSSQQLTAEGWSLDKIAEIPQQVLSSDQGKVATLAGVAALASVIALRRASAAPAVAELCGISRGARTALFVGEPVTAGPIRAVGNSLSAQGDALAQQLRFTFAPSAAEQNILRSITHVEGAPWLNGKRILVTDDFLKPIEWQARTAAARDHSYQALFKGRLVRSIYTENGQMVSAHQTGRALLGPEQTFLIQHFGGPGQTLNRGMAREADRIICCFPERLPAFARNKHLFPGSRGEISVNVFETPLQATPSGKALVVETRMGP